MASGKVTVADILQVRDECLSRVQEDYLYQVRNAAKLRAVTTSANYDEFRDIVNSAHLNPLSRADKRNSSTRTNLWSPITRQ